MDIEPLVKPIPILAGALVTLAGLPKAIGPDKHRRALKYDADLLALLPPDTAPHKRMLESIDERLEAVLANDLHARRDWGAGAASVLMTAVLVWLAMWLMPRGAWGIAGAIIVLMLMTPFAYGIFESFSKVPRDDRGKRLPTKSGT